MQGREIEGGSDGCPAATDDPSSVALAAIPGDRRNTSESCDLSAISRPDHPGHLERRSPVRDGHRPAFHPGDRPSCQHNADRRNARDRHHHRRRSCRTHGIGPGCARQWNASRKTGHRRRAPCPEARDVPGGAGRSTSQPKHENLRGSPPQGRKTAQGYHYRRRQKADHHRQGTLQEPSEMGSPGSMKDTVARDVKWMKLLLYRNETSKYRAFESNIPRSIRTR